MRSMGEMAGVPGTKYGVPTSMHTFVCAPAPRTIAEPRIIRPARPFPMPALWMIPAPEPANPAIGKASSNGESAQSAYEFVTEGIHRT
jgi:hypothetical protein